MIVERTRMEAGDVQCRRRFSGVPARYALAFMFFLGFVTSLFLRVTLSVAIIEMKARRKSRSQVYSAPIRIYATYRKNSAGIRRRAVSDSLEYRSSISRYYSTVGIILSAFYFGYVVTQLPFGILAAKYGSKRVFGGGVLCASLLSLLTPFAAYYKQTLILLRILQGLALVSRTCVSRPCTTL